MKISPPIEIIGAENVPSSKLIPYSTANIRVARNANSESIYFTDSKVVLMYQMEEIIALEAPLSEYLLFKKILALLG